MPNEEKVDLPVSLWPVDDANGTGDSLVDDELVDSLVMLRDASVDEPSPLDLSCPGNDSLGVTVVLVNSIAPMAVPAPLGLVILCDD